MGKGAKREASHGRHDSSTFLRKLDIVSNLLSNLLSNFHKLDLVSNLLSNLLSNFCCYWGPYNQNLRYNLICCISVPASMLVHSNNVERTFCSPLIFQEIGALRQIYFHFNFKELPTAHCTTLCT